MNNNANDTKNNYVNKNVNNNVKTSGNRKAKDYRSVAQPKWCPGCGCFALLKSVANTYAFMNVPNEDIAVISGIGCSSRFPYYVESYGFHTIHGRAPTVAMGLKMARPDLSVWIVTGDGDLLSIGGNHFIHLMRRNADLNLMLFNNEIYGLTKGQASPASKMGQVTKTTPLGSIDTPMKPATMAVSAGATFVARLLDSDIRKTQEVLAEGAAHKGTSFVEILFNCVTFNDGVFNLYKDDETAADHTIRLEAGKPLIFGKENDKALILKSSGEIEIVKVKDVSPEVILVHNPENHLISYLLSQLADPLPLGILKKVSAPTYGERFDQQVEQAVAKFGKGKIEDLMKGADSWIID